MNTPAPDGHPIAGKLTRFFDPIRLLALALLASLLVYTANIGDFFFHDSAPVLSENSAILISGGSLEEWRTAAISTDTGPLGRPLSMLSFAANHVLSGSLDPVAVKFTNIVLHAAAGVLLWLFLVAVLASSPILGLDRERARLVAAIAAALWLLHPLHVSTVLYAVQRMTQLASLFTLLGLWQLATLRARWLEVPPAASDYSRALLLVLGWTAAATLSKESGLLLPLLAAVTELVFFRFRVAGGRSALLQAAVAAALGGTLLLLLAVPLLAPEFMQAWYAQRPFTLGERLLTQGRMLWHYLGWIYLPDITAMGFNHDDIPISQSVFAPLTTLLALLAFAAWGWLAWRLRRSWPLLAFALLWFLVGHLLESTIVPLELSYEHRNYLPSIGPLLLLAGLAVQFSPERAGLARAGLALLLVALVPLLYLRGANWTSELRLAETNYRNHPASAKSLFNLATAYYEEALATDDAERRRTLFAASRAAALRLLEGRGDYVPALVWLIILDSNSSDATRVVEWQQRLARSLAGPVLHASDVKFLMVLNDCVSRELCPEPPQGHESFLRSLAERHPMNPHLRYELARFCQAAGRADCARRQAEALLELEPRFLRALEIIYLVERDAGQLGRAQETARRLMRADGQRQFARGLLGSGEGDGR